MVHDGHLVQVRQMLSRASGYAVKAWSCQPLTALTALRIKKEIKKQKQKALLAGVLVALNS